ncbi:MAG: GvpL/GvpF family gas vesicle protein [Acidobacteria bacterium]|nr:GvpL/GvpF family gas vesicle protein [Acidobacteriota bacterium]MCA1648805.1 GvpL/GvpF family gas vesicle protein [Acidobacteriota bacterium]
MSAVYVYALLDSARRPARIGRHAIEFVGIGSICAAVERVSERPAVSETALRDQHDVVTRLARNADAILPARFGSLIELAELERMVARHEHTIEKALELVRGREQMTLRLFADGAGVTSSDMAPASPPSSGTAYLAMRAAATAIPPEVEGLRAKLGSLVIAERVERGEGRLHATVWHLIARGSSGRYHTAVAGLADDLAPLRLAVSGPWPPFAFAPAIWQ